MSSSKRRFWISLAMVAVIGIFAVPAVARRVARHGVAVDQVEVVGLEGSDSGLLGRVGSALKAGEEAAVGGSVTVRVKARNTRPLPVWVRSARFHAWVGGREIGHGTWTAPSGRQFFWPGKDVTLELELVGDSAAMRGAGLRYLEGKPIEGEGRGEVEAGIPPVFVTLPFEVKVVARKGAKNP